MSIPDAGSLLKLCMYHLYVVYIEDTLLLFFVLFLWGWLGVGVVADFCCCFILFLFFVRVCFFFLFLFVLSVCLLLFVNCFL